MNMLQLHVPGSDPSRFNEIAHALRMIGIAIACGIDVDFDEATDNLRLAASRDGATLIYDIANALETAIRLRETARIQMLLGDATASLDLAKARSAKAA
jgi:hypothetical protein